MESADNVKLRYGFGISRSGSSKSLFEGHRISARRIFFPSKRTQTAGGHADVGGVDVTIDVEVCLISVHALAEVIGHPSHRQNVAGPVQNQRIGSIQALSRHYFLLNRP